MKGSCGHKENVIGRYGPVLRLHRRAFDDLSTAIAIGPASAEVFQMRALALALLGQDAEAQQDVDQASAMGMDTASLLQAINDIKTRRPPAISNGSTPR